MTAQELEVKVLELKGKYKIIRVGNVRFDRIAECVKDISKERWVGVIEGEKEEIPIFCRRHEGFTIEQIQKCCDATANFLEFLDKENKREKRKSG